MVADVIKIFVPSAFAFVIGLGITPLVTHFLYKHKLWKKKVRSHALGGGETPIFSELHKDKEVGTPRMGGIVIWASVIFTVVLFYFISQLLPLGVGERINFLSRNQTWLPLFTLIAASLVGLVDDVLQVSGGGSYVAGGLSLTKRILLVLLIGAVGGWWFYSKLGVSELSVPLAGTFYFGAAIVPMFMLVMLAVFSGGVIDGIDGLAGGIMASVFSAYATIAFFQTQVDLAAFCAVVVGAILAFLWFNIPPARFYMSETGILGLTAALAVVAFLTDAVPELLIIALPLFVASGSVIIQLLSKKIIGKKIFLVAPIHHHFEALGWPPYKVTMRFWILSVVCAIIGTAIALMS